MSHSQSQVINTNYFYKTLNGAVYEFITIHNNFLQTITNICNDDWKLSTIHDEQKTLKTKKRAASEELKNTNELNSYISIVKELKTTMSAISFDESKHETLDHYLETNLYEAIQAILDNLENNFGKMYALMTQLTQLYDYKKLTKYKIDNVTSDVIASPYQMIARYPLLLEGISKALAKINTDPSLKTDTDLSDRINKLKKSIDSVAQKIKELNEKNYVIKTQTKESAELETIKTPKRKEIARRNKETQKNNNYADIYFLNQLYQFFLLLEISMPDTHKKMFSRIYRLIYSYSYLPINLNRELSDPLNILRPIIIDIFEEHQFSFANNEDSKNFSNIFSLLDNKNLSSDVLADGQEEMIKNYFNTLELHIIKDINKLIEQSPNIDLVQAAKLKNISIGKSKTANCLLFDFLKKEYNDIWNAGQYGELQLTSADLSHHRHEISNAIKELKPYFINNQDTPTQKQVVRPIRDKFKFNIKFRTLDLNNKLVSGLIKNPKNLLINLMRLYHYYLNTALGKDLCVNEGIAENTDQHWNNVLQNLIEQIIIQKLNEKTHLDKEFFDLIKDAVNYIKDRSITSHAISGVIGEWTSNLLLGSRLENTLVYIHDIYAPNNIAKINPNAPHPESMLSTCLIKPNPKESFDDYFQKTCLLFCISKLNVAPQTNISKSVTSTLNIICFSLQPEERIMFLTEKLKNNSITGQNSFLFLLNEYIKVFIANQEQKYEGNKSSLITNSIFSKHKDPCIELTNLLDCAVNKTTNTNEKQQVANFYLLPNSSST